MAEIPNFEDIQKERSQEQQKKPAPNRRDYLSFTELLGSYRVSITHLYIPILICIGSATFLAWLTGLVPIDITPPLPYPDEGSFWEVLINGIVPVAISALFVVVLWFLIKRFGLIVLKIVMGLVVMFYTWYGFVFFMSIIFFLLPEDLWTMVVNNWSFTYGLLFDILYYILFFGSAIGLLIATVQYFRNRLTIQQRNLLILSYGIFMGSIFGKALPMWTTFAFAFFLSVWDIITVFRGPLGKIANLLRENQQEAQQQLQYKIDTGQISSEEAEKLPLFASLQRDQDPNYSVKDHLREIEIELGSGDLILYSALVANVFINTHNWVITGAVLVGVVSGLVLTLYFLLAKRRMLPALPFSMLFGIIAFFISGGWRFIV